MEAYIVGGYRTAVGKAKRGGFRHTRSDDLGIAVIKHLMKQFPQLDKHRIDDVIVGCAVPEGEQGLQIGRIIALGALGVDVPGMTVNRYCASGIETISIATAMIKSGMADCIIAGGAESMSLIPTVGWRTAPNFEIAETHADYYSSMGLTAEAVASEYKVSREEQDEFSYQSHLKALKAQEQGLFKEEIIPFDVKEIDVKNGKKVESHFVVDTDEGPRKDTKLESLLKLKPVFAANGSVTAGNSSQMSDGAGFVLVMSEKMVKEMNVEPIARIVASARTGVEPRVMGIGPCTAVPKVLKQAGLKLNDIDLMELNEAFASQSIAVVKKLGIDPGIVNVNGGAIALGHPFACTGARLTLTINNELRRRKGKYGIVTMCVGGGQGFAAVVEHLS